MDFADHDPFQHHPDLRALIKPPEASFFRDFQPTDLDDRMLELGVPQPWRHSDAEREADRRRVLAEHPGGDLWVFAYGSLMWDPALRFAEVRRATLDGFARKFCLLDTLGGRGTPECPGLMAGLDRGEGCDGLVFRIAEADIEDETGILWRRERLCPGYVAAHVAARTGFGPVSSLAFLADPKAPQIDLDIPFERQAHHLATGQGFLGTSLEYIESLVQHFDAMEIRDDNLRDLCNAARSLAGEPPGRTEAGPP